MRWRLVHPLYLALGASSPDGPGLATFVEWDVRNWSVALDVWSAYTAQRVSGREALEIGSRNGGLSLWLALRGAHVVCSDVTGPTSRAITAHRAAGVQDRITYAAIDARRLPFRERFDLVVFKSVLGALDPGDQAEAVRSMYAALKPGGELFFAENLAGSALHAYCRRRFVSWGRSWHYVPVEDMLTHLAPFSSVQYRTFGFAGAFGRSPGARDLLGTVDRIALSRLVPERWRYIIAGVARR